MAREIPEAVRAVAGLAATVLDEARKLPETLPGLPVRLVGAAMQTSLRVQQQYAGLVARGDELLTGLRGDSGAGLATFDDDDDEQPSAAPVVGTPARDSAFDRVSEADLDALHDEQDDDLGAVAEVVDLPADAAADLVTAVVDELADDVAEEVAEELPEALPDDVADELTADAVAGAADTEVDDETAIEEAVAEDLVADAVVTDEDLAAEAAPTLDDTAPPVAALAEATEELSDLGGPDAAAEAADELATTDGNGGGPAVTAPIEGYDSFSIPALRGHLRAYPAETVADLLDYERATHARAPYVTLLQNRLEKLNADRG
ncbi:lipid droplet-associated protein [Modestobacter sp. NPDC049651]|uniref:lipid droplet-associated protein n=1 Tax=unclassified Modestobacter TaxID=2643866 RepID=UPI0033D667AC